MTLRNGETGGRSERQREPVKRARQGQQEPCGRFVGRGERKGVMQKSYIPLRPLQSVI